ncbi:MAG: VWA domain-containing protein [Acidobacteria bacterium]|nr:VWA domain-containing protein [Acidobacteriota bacterium]
MLKLAIHRARVLVAAIIAAGCAAGQTSPGNSVLRAGRIQVNAVVMDRHERLVTSLGPGDFHLTVDKFPAKIDSFWKEDGPVSAVIVFDTSGSMAPALKRGRDALQAFLRQEYPGDEYALVVCKEKPSLEVGFTNDVSAIAASPHLVATKGKTALYDALGMAMHVLSEARNTRKVIFVISDGIDNASRIRHQEVMRMLGESDVFLYAVEFWTSAQMDDVPPPRSYLADFADLTGGVYFGEVTPNEFIKVLSRLDIHQRYLLTFQPRRREGDGRYHKVGLQLTGDSRRQKLLLYWRHGYRDRDSAPAE